MDRQEHTLAVVHIRAAVRTLVAAHTLAAVHNILCILQEAEELDYSNYTVHNRDDNARHSHGNVRDHVRDRDPILRKHP